MSSVKLGIRVRPFTDRELRSDKDRTQVVNVHADSTVSITNVKVSVSGAGDSRARVRHYPVDYAFDSACPTTHPAYASQEKVFNSIGSAVIDDVLRGCSACILAYGQSATGKTYTMMGSDQEPGLVPRICKALAQKLPFDITVSFLEIYNERVHDLLAGESAPPTCHSLPRRRGNARKDLRVREHPDKGPYVQNLRRVAIHSVEALLSLVTEGANRRRTAATRRNPNSSRSHALLELSTPTATVHLADLAGSEKSGWEGCGGRQKEGSNINKSLVALSNVISALVNKGSGRSRFVPYRDSALTWLLKDCFTGGGSTYIIATVSPSVTCYGESAATLRWAARARFLPVSSTTAVRSSNNKDIQLQHTQLLTELAREYILYVPETGKISYDDKHWNLYSNNVKEVANIGNIMNLIHPKNDAQSESTASSVASGSSDVINTMDKTVGLDISKEINKEVNKLFVPALERTQSNSDLKVIAPLRHKRRQYKSQEVLAIEAKHHPNLPALPSHSGQSNGINDTDKPKTSQMPILYDNQRAEIVASVTERLYNKMKRKEEAVASKVEAVIDKKIMEPLNELKICTNARQRLVDLSQKALRNRRKIGIPAYTQTRKMVTRVRDQSIDAQNDLETYYYKNSNNYTIKRDVSTETMPMTPRCKDIAVGSKFGTLYTTDNSTATEIKKILFTSSLCMTDMVKKCDRSSQTQILPPPRRKKRESCCNCVRENTSHLHVNEKSDSIISINISQSYIADSETQSSDDNSETTPESCGKVSSLNMTPDLIINHNTIETLNADATDSKETCALNVKTVDNSEKSIPMKKIPDNNLLKTDKNNDFSDSDECEIPRVKIDYNRKSDLDEIKNMILGRSDKTYPYNIVLSPPKDRDESKRLVKFCDKRTPVVSVSSQTNWSDKCLPKVQIKTSNETSNADCSNNGFPKTKMDNEINLGNSDEKPKVGMHSASDSTESSIEDAGSFIWSNCFKGLNKYEKVTNNLGKTYAPVYKPKIAMYAKSKAKVYREFLGLDKEYPENDGYCLNTSSTSKDVTTTDSAESQEMCHSLFEKRKQYFEENLPLRSSRKNSFRRVEEELLNKCNSLEISVNKYENYLDNHKKNESNVRLKSYTPKEYLQHLVQLRREVVRGDYDSSGSLGEPYN